MSRYTAKLVASAAAVITLTMLALFGAVPLLAERMGQRHATVVGAIIAVMVCVAASCACAALIVDDAEPSRR